MAFFTFRADFAAGKLCLLGALLILLSCLSESTAMAQPPDAPPAEKKIIEIMHAEELLITEDKDIQIRKLSGDVILKQDDVILKCDSALFFPRENDVKAYGKVEINQGDSLDIYSDYLFYNGNTKIIRLYDNVLLKDETSEIKSDSLIYNANTKKAVLHQKVPLNRW